MATIRFGPTAIEPPADIVDLYEPRIFGWLAFAWLVIFVGVLVLNSLHEGYAWWRLRRDQP